MLNIAVWPRGRYAPLEPPVSRAARGRSPRRHSAPPEARRRSEAPWRNKADDDVWPSALVPRRIARTRTWTATAATGSRASAWRGATPLPACFRRRAEFRGIEGAGPPLASPDVAHWVSGIPEAQITVRNHVSSIRTARSAVLTVGRHLNVTATKRGIIASNSENALFGQNTVSCGIAHASAARALPQLPTHQGQPARPADLSPRVPCPSCLNSEP